MHIKQWLGRTWFKKFIVCLTLLTNFLFIFLFMARLMKLIYILLALVLIFCCYLDSFFLHDYFYLFCDAESFRLLCLSFLSKIISDQHCRGICRYRVEIIVEGIKYLWIQVLLLFCTKLNFYKSYSCEFGKIRHKMQAAAFLRWKGSNASRRGLKFMHIWQLAHRVVKLQ